MPVLRARPCIAASLLILTASCGPPLYRISTVIGPERLNDSTAIVDSAEINVRFGAEWVEIAIRNTSSRPLDVFWGNSVLRAPSGLEHHLVERATRNIGTSQQGNGPGASHTLQLRHGMNAFHVSWQEMPTHEDAVRIDPRRGMSVVLYPIEHLMTMPDGSTLVGPLDCPDALAPDAMGSPWETIIPASRRGVPLLLRVLAILK